MKPFALLLNLLMLVLNGSSSQTPGHKKTGADKFITVNIQPLGNISEEQVKYVHGELIRIFPSVWINQAIPLPLSAFYAPRNRYRADSLIAFLNRVTEDGQVTIGITTKDISTTKGKIQDWGVMGLGFCPGKACVVSTFRLSKNELLDQLFKTCIHELGHTQGLDHCPVKTCFMRDAEGGNPTNEETGFCSNCKAILIAKGWNFQ